MSVCLSLFLVSMPSCWGEHTCAHACDCLMRAKVLSPHCRARCRACIVSLHVQANLPSLLALPYYGWIANTDPLYIATRKAVLSSQNPWWFK